MGNNNSILYIILSLMAVLLIINLSVAYSFDNKTQDTLIDFREQTERTHSDISKRLADLAKNNA